MARLNCWSSRVWASDGATASVSVAIEGRHRCTFGRRTLKAPAAVWFARSRVASGRPEWGARNVRERPPTPPLQARCSRRISMPAQISEGKQDGQRCGFRKIFKCFELPERPCQADDEERPTLAKRRRLVIGLAGDAVNLAHKCNRLLAPPPLPVRAACVCVFVRPSVCVSVCICPTAWRDRNDSALTWAMNRSLNSQVAVDDDGWRWKWKPAGGSSGRARRRKRSRARSGKGKKEPRNLAQTLARACGARYCEPADDEDATPTPTTARTRTKAARREGGGGGGGPA
jgi:hypothetical protein